LLTFRDFVIGFRKLDIDPPRPIIAHASLAAFGKVNGGAQTIIGALGSSFNTVIMPAFTYRTMIIPEVGPPDNAIVYGSGKDTNRMAEIFRPGMPADKMMGIVAESLRTHPQAYRSMHPILSFVGLNARHILDTQTIQEPLNPIQALTNGDGWVVLLGVDQTVNTSIHYAERQAGREQFIRWALTPKGVVACPGFPGCSDGFEAVSSQMADTIRRVVLGETVIQAMPLDKLVDAVCTMIKDDPTALLCGRTDCGRCYAVRASISS
jgi:aminoglycoside 3-N-acetyltransferase